MSQPMGSFTAAACLFLLLLGEGRAFSGFFGRAASGRFVDSVFPGWKGEVVISKVQAEAEGSLASHVSPDDVRASGGVQLFGSDRQADLEGVEQQQQQQQQQQAESEVPASTQTTKLRWNTHFLLHRREWKQEEWQGEVEEISLSPRLYKLHHFLSDAECDHLIEKAKPQMESSTVVNNTSGKKIASSVRTSWGTFFDRGEDEVVARVEKRISLLTHVPVQNGEGMQILRYTDGQKYEPHTDFFHDNVNPAPENGGQRLATLLLYLSTVEEGGETVFPRAANGGVPPRGPEFSECARRGLAVKPTKGDAVLFYGLHPNGEKDWASLHGSCPILKGQKWSATKWLRVQQYGGNTGIGTAI